MGTKGTKMTHRAGGGALYRNAIPSISSSTACC